MKKFLGVTLLAGTLLFNTASTSAAPAPIKDRETIYQVALLQSLAMGYFDGSISVKDLKTHGDTGIGTFEGLNGEMIVLDGVVYQANQDLKINVMGDKETVPFSNVTFFDKDFSVKLSNVADKAAFEKILNEHVNKHGRNSFYMVKVSGTFNEILIRSEAGAKEPYPTLVEALKTQKEITPKNISGTIVGLYCPDFMSSLNSTGWHFHFISADKKIGGHVLDLNLKSGEVQFDKTDAFKMDLPKKNNFHALNFKQDMNEDIRKAEQDVQGGK
ncbi:MAG: acetolactate decarboxylase [Selenomonadaceae bacterium]|nr:acetolactate decarboxylase [Selenomonadaceae bacterium]